MRSHSHAIQSTISLSATSFTPLLHVTCRELLTLATTTVAPDRTSVSTIVTVSISSIPSATVTRTFLGSFPILVAILNADVDRCDKTILQEGRKLLTVRRPSIEKYHVRIRRRSGMSKRFGQPEASASMCNWQAKAMSCFIFHRRRLYVPDLR